MLANRSFVILGVLLMGMVGIAVSPVAGAENWPTWRGPDGTGVAPSGNPPVTWSETENIKWKVAIPGKGQSTPIIWGDRIFIQTAIPLVGTSGIEEKKEGDKRRGRGGPWGRGIPVAHKFNVLCFDRGTGALIWEKTVIEATPHEGTHYSGTHAAYSPVTDGKHVWVNFGSRGLYALDMDGEILWSDKLIKMETAEACGEGSSPAIAGDAIVVVADHEGQSKILAFNKLTGAPLWERSRDEITSWATPQAVEIEGKMRVIVSGTTFTRSYDAKTGDIIWQCSGQTRDVIPSPVLGFGNVYCVSGYQGNSFQAIKLDSRGDVSGTDAVLWHTAKTMPYVPSPLLYGDNLYLLLGTKGIISCYDAKTGKSHYEEERLSGLRNVYASPLGVADRIYISDLSGNTAVIKHGDSLEVLAINTLDEGFTASPVSLGDELYLRGTKHLYCIAKP